MVLNVLGENSDKGKILVLMKVEPSIIPKLFLNFSNFEPQYFYRLYSYKKSVLKVY